jgi:hypothetical protein
MRAALLVVALAGSARGDGGTVRASERCGPYRVTAFSSPVPLRAGPVDVSVLVQDDRTRAVADVPVTVRVSPAGRAGPTMTRAATTEAATNKLLKAALFELPTAGTYDVAVEVNGQPAVRFSMDAGEPLPGLPALAWWVGWPALAVAAFVLHRALVRRKVRDASQRRSGEMR